MSRRRAIFPAFVLALMSATVSPAASEIGRRMLDEAEAVPFRAVGRLNIAGTRFCTATLVAPRRVVTAAHCLFNPRTGARVRTDELRFVAGLRLGRTAAVRNIVGAVIEPAFVFDGKADPAGVGSDLALLALDEPVGPGAATPIQSGALPKQAGTPFAIVSYGRDRSQAPSIEAPCTRASLFSGTIALDCPVTSGNSGAPVLAGEGGERRVVAVVSAMGRAVDPEREITLAAVLAPRIEALTRDLAALLAGEGEGCGADRPKVCKSMP